MSTTETTGIQAGDQDAREKAQEVAGTAAKQAGQVAGTVREEAAQVAGEARDQIRGLFSEATTQVEEQSRNQQHRLAGTARTFSDDLSGMAESRSGLASDLAREVADRTRSLAAQLEDREPRDLLEDVRGFARNRPGTFLLGAMAAGLLAGRLTKAARGSSDQSTDTPGGMPPTTSWADPQVAPTPTVGPVTPVEQAPLGAETTAPSYAVPSQGIPPVDPGSRP